MQNIAFNSLNFLAIYKKKLFELKLKALSKIHNDNCFTVIENRLKAGYEFFFKNGLLVVKNFYELSAYAT